MTADASFLGFAVIGLLLGLRHATDADHVVAVTTMVAQERRLGAAMRIGAAWGVGHTVTIVAFGGAIIVFRLGLPPSLNTVAEAAVGIVLILLGIRAIAARSPSDRAGADRVVVHSHGHWHGGVLHSHPHAHAPEDAESHQEHKLARGMILAPGSGVRAFAVGMVHGLAGSAAIALAVLAAIPKPLWGVFYLLIFGVGALAGMMAITVVLAMPGIAMAGKFSRASDFLRLGSGAVSIALGLVMIRPLIPM